jgi:hypothetical protein
MSISAVSPSVPMKPPEASVPKPAEIKADGGTRKPQPTVLAALPPGQGTQINQLA